MWVELFRRSDLVRCRPDVRHDVVDRWGTGRICSAIVEIEWESTKYTGKRPCAGFCADLHVCCMFAYPILIKSAAELSKCSLKYEPSVFNINTNVKDGITQHMHCNRFLKTNVHFKSPLPSPASAAAKGMSWSGGLTSTGTAVKCQPPRLSAATFFLLMCL